MWPPIEDRPSDQMAPRKDSPGCFLRIAWFMIAGWWLALLTTVIAWGLIVSGTGTPTGMRLLTRLPRLLFREPPDDRYLAATRDVAQAIEGQSDIQRAVPVRLVYTVVVGWWLSGLSLLAAWLLLLSVAGIPLACQIYRNAPRRATLAVYELAGSEKE